MSVKDQVSMRGKVVRCAISEKGETFATIMDAADDAGRYPYALSVKLLDGGSWKEGAVGDFVLNGYRTSFKGKFGVQETLVVETAKVSWYVVRLDPVPTPK